MPALAVSVPLASAVAVPHAVAVGDAFAWAVAAAALLAPEFVVLVLDVVDAVPQALTLKARALSDAISRPRAAGGLFFMEWSSSVSSGRKRSAGAAVVGSAGRCPWVGTPAVAGGLPGCQEALCWNIQSRNAVIW
ncbi:hypothetical protein ABZ281_36825 [Streptomyces sp. NPDC006265]|uniref:hypothetical protein n=1 Tax=Streptomyces sp. NPDC006265 TaxID=3156740 RepID=UPI0033BC2F3E